MNDEAESKKLVRKLNQIAQTNDCVICVTIHPNVNSDKAAGNLGAFLYRYSRAMLLLQRNSKEKDVRELVAQGSTCKMQYWDTAKWLPAYYNWDTTIEQLTPTTPPEEAKLEEMALMAFQECNTDEFKNVAAFIEALEKVSI